MATGKIHFANKSGDALYGLIDLPEKGAPRTFALFAHCFTCSKNYRAPRNISKTLAKNGIGTLTFDFTGLGDSEGDFAETNFSSNVGDLVSAASFLEESYEAPRILIGHSLGGAAVLQAASRVESARALVTIAAPSELSQLSKLLASRAEDIDAEGTVKVKIAGRSFRLKKGFFEDLERTRMEQTIKKLHLPLMIFHSPADKTVDIEHAVRIFKLAAHPKSLVSLDGADHLLSNKADSAFVAGVISSWVERYFEDAG